MQHTVLMRVFDAHLHLLNPPTLRYGWLAGDLDAVHGPSQLSATYDDEERAAVFVQADVEPEHAVAEVDWIVSVAPEAGVKGIVAWAPLEDSSRTRRLLDHYRGIPLVRGVRRLMQSMPDDLIRGASFRASCGLLAERDLVFDACVRWPQLAEVTSLADAVPELRIVLDHLGKPPVDLVDGRQLEDSDWARHLASLALRPSVQCKLSGLPAEFPGPWTSSQITPFLDVALTHFGPDRIMYGSDWPVSARDPLEARRWRRSVASWATDRLGPGGADAVMWRNAERAYVSEHAQPAPRG